MDNTTYIGSDTDGNETYENCDFHSMASNGLDFVDHWVNLTMEKEILRGSKLRDEKLRSYSRHDEYEVVNIDFIRPPCIDMNTSYYRKSLQRKSKVKTNSCSPWSDSPVLRDKARGYTPQSNTYSRPNTPSVKPKYAKRCPMRIAELAVPTKRQCIETWRNKCGVLPALMVDRLRQQIMDEKPVVEIKEAISCFKRRKPRSIKSVKRSKKVIRDSKLKNERMDEIRNLCVVFANKIAQRLITPQNLKLTPELENISKVVADELTNIIQNRKKFDLDVVTSKRIKAEISEKITVWIARILEDTSHKLLEEDLRVKKDSELNNAKEERLITFIGKLQHQVKNSELEEEEGPVLDFIDDVVDNVVTICELPDIEMEEIDHISKTPSKASCEENNDLTNTSYDTEYELNIDDHIRGEIINIINSVVPTYHEYDIKTALENESNVTEEHKDVHMAPGNSELIFQIKGIQNSFDLASPEDVGLSSKNGSEDGKDDSNVDDIQQNIKADSDSESEVLEHLNEESSDDKDKKVKFSEVEIDARGASRQLDNSSALQSTEGHGHDKERVSWHSSTNVHDMTFAPPNENLLSDADELWPDDIATPILKPSASVNRSVTSLGKIMEKDEKLLLSQDEIRAALNWEAPPQTEFEISNQPDENFSHKDEPLEHTQKLNEQESQIAADIDEESHTDSKHRENLDDVTDAIAFALHTVKTREEKAMIDKTVKANVALMPETKGLISDSSTSPIKIAIIDATLKNTQKIKEKSLTSLTETNIKCLESDTNVIYEAIQQKMKTSYSMAEPKHDFKVHAKTAPSWLRHDRGKGEPSEDSFQGNKCKEKFKDSDVRNWCKDLDRIFANLEIWNSWIDTTCKNIMQLREKREMKKLFVPNARRKHIRDWITLKKNIDKDTILWTKLNQRAYERLKTYKDKAKIVSTEYCMLCDCKNTTKRKV